MELGRRHQRANADLVRQRHPLGDLLAELVSERRFVETKQEAAGDPQVVADHRLVEVELGVSPRSCDDR